ncbi:Ribonucleoside-diphosphate reductase large subunit, partial [Hondaea fermentalgiana]
MRHRPLGLGVSGLQDLLFKRRLPFDSAGAREVNKKVFEAIYFGAMQMSVELARCNGPYASYEGSPLSKGKLACDLWGSEPQMHEYFDWEGLRRDLAAFGARNSLLIALMPTASSSTLLGVNECFEPITANVYLRKTLSGEFVLINRYLVQDLCERGIWSDDLAQQLIAANGSVSEIEGVPTDIKALYRTAWEISNRAIIDMAAERHPWVCQSQSMNLFLKHPTASSLTRMYYYAFNKGLKSIVYYLRMQPKA